MATGKWFEMLGHKKGKKFEAVSGIFLTKTLHFDDNFVSRTHSAALVMCFTDARMSCHGRRGSTTMKLYSQSHSVCSFLMKNYTT